MAPIVTLAVMKDEDIVRVTNVFDTLDMKISIHLDFDGDMCFLTSLFTDKFRQADFIIYNNNDTGSKQEKAILTEELVQRSIRANLQQNMLGVICNINTRALELMNDKKSLHKFVQLTGYKDNVGFGFDKAQMPYFPKFKDKIRL